MPLIAPLVARINDHIFPYFFIFKLLCNFQFASFNFRYVYSK